MVDPIQLAGFDTKLELAWASIIPEVASCSEASLSSFQEDIFKLREWKAHLASGQAKCYDHVFVAWCLIDDLEYFLRFSFSNDAYDKLCLNVLRSHKQPFLEPLKDGFKRDSSSDMRLNINWDFGIHYAFLDCSVEISK